jgi:hypothetical protein
MHTTPALSPDVITLVFGLDLPSPFSFSAPRLTIGLAPLLHWIGTMVSPVQQGAFGAEYINSHSHSNSRCMRLEFSTQDGRMAVFMMEVRWWPVDVRLRLVREPLNGEENFSAQISEMASAVALRCM